MEELTSKEINANMCSICKEVWNESNMKIISLDNYSLHLCPDCYNGLEKKLHDVTQQVFDDGYEAGLALGKVFGRFYEKHGLQDGDDIPSEFESELNQALNKALIYRQSSKEE